MVVGFVITFRETLEAALIIGIVISYLRRTKNRQFIPSVWLGLATGIILSAAFAIGFTTIGGGFEGKAEQIFEGITFTVAVVLITTLVFWLIGHTTVRRKIEEKVSKEVNNQRKIGLAALIMISVLREGVETVIFLGAATLAEESRIELAFGIAGIVAAVVIAFAFFKGTSKLPLKTFFTATTIILILFAAAMAAAAIHEFQEAEILPGEDIKAWNINPQQNLDGTYPPLHDKGIIGSMLKGLVGYNGNPSWLEVIGYFGYLVFTGITWLQYKKKREKIL
ncbi:MAG: FTR1 family protein [Nanoarchaeota archaeon]